MDTTKLITVTYADNRSPLELWADATWWHGAILMLGGGVTALLVILAISEIAWRIRWYQQGKRMAANWTAITGRRCKAGSWGYYKRNNGMKWWE